MKLPDGQACRFACPEGKGDAQRPAKTRCARRSSCQSAFGRGFNSPHLHQRGITRTFLLCRRLCRHNMVQVIPTEKNGYSHLLRVSVLSLCPADCPWTICGQSQNAAIFTYRSVRFTQFLTAHSHLRKNPHKHNSECYNALAGVQG